MAIRKSSSSGIPFGNDANRPANPQVGQPYFNGESSRLELYTSSVGWQNIVQETPAVVNVVGQLNETASSTIQINGTNFAVGATVFAVGTNGVETSATTTTLVSVVEITAVFPPLSPAYAPYDVKVVNPSNLYGVLYETLGVNDSPVWSTSAGTLGTFTELQAVSVTVAATDAADSTNSPLSYSVVSGALPGGLTLNSSTGVISGTASNVIPNTTYSFTIAATDGRNTAVTRAFSITINDRSPVWSTGTTLPAFTRNVAYSTTVAATEDDAGAITYSLVSGSLPTGLSLSSAGVISGTTTSSTNATFTVRATVTDSGTTSDRAFTMPNAGPVWSTAATLPTFTRNVAYSTTVVATDDSGNNPTYSLVSGSLPTGLSLSSAGVISGTTTSSTNATFTVRATDANGNTADRAFTMPNAGPVWSTSGTIPYVGSYSYQLVASDDSGVAPTYSLASGALPSGLSLSASGLITGSTSQSGSPASVTFRATDSNGSFTDQSLSFELPLYLFTNHTFTTAGRTRTSGPSLAEARSAYSSTSWANTYLQMDYNGYQKWTPPHGGMYRFQIAGASGGYGNGATDSSFGGQGRVLSFDYNIPANSTVQIAVGQHGGFGRNASFSRSGGGGGATTVFLTSGETLLGMAGGGGGSTNSGGQAGHGLFSIVNGGSAGSSSAGAGGGSWDNTSASIGGGSGNGSSDGAAIKPSAGRFGVSSYTWNSAAEYDGYGGFPGGGSAVDNQAAGGGAGYGGGNGGGTGSGGGSYTHPSATNVTDLGLNGGNGSYDLNNGYCIVTKL